MRGVPSGVIDPATDGSPTFLDRYAAGALDDLFDRPALDLEGGLDRGPVDDPGGLAAALADQARERGDRPAQLAAIERLADPRTRAIVTGQQAGLLLGPMFTLSKAITAIRLAKRLDTPERPVVAVFWVASQDHDAAEIDHAWLLGNDEELVRLSLPFPEGQPSGRTPWRRDWTDAVSERLRAVYGDGPLAAEARALARSACESGDTVADVFARTLASLFGDDGLVILDPMRPRIARRFGPVLRHEIAEPTAGPEAIREAAEALRGRGLRPQLGRAADATNLFVQADDGPRLLLRFDGRRFHPDGRPDLRWSADDLLGRLDDDPASITPAAGLRPIVQDGALPTAAVVVGPGELRYFSQLRGVYRHHAVPMPTVWPRAQVTLLEPPVARILDRHETTADAFASDPERVQRERLLELHGAADAFARTTDRLETDVAALLGEIDALDPTLDGPVRRGHAALDLTVSRLRDKAADALARRDRITTDQFARLRAHLIPGGQPQERVLSPFSFFSKFGVGPVMDRLKGLEPEGRQTLSIDP